MTWPISSPVFGTYQWLQTSVGMYLGYGPAPNAWDPEQDAIVDWVVQQGVGQFYNPPMMEGQAEPHIWSFLKISATLTLGSADYDYDLPTDFAGVIYDVTHQVGDAERRLKIVDEHTIRSLQAKNDQSAVSLYIAVRPKAVGLTAEQTYEAIVYPTPDATYTLEYRYKQNHAPMTTTNLYPLGTRAHSQSLLFSCYAIAECYQSKTIGPMYQRFVQQLSASLAIDRMADRGGEIRGGLTDLKVV